jgi:hypothetical protein
MPQGNHQTISGHSERRAESLFKPQRCFTRLSSVQNHLNIQYLVNAILSENSAGVERDWRLAGSRGFCSLPAKRHDEEWREKFFPQFR